MLGSLHEEPGASEEQVLGDDSGVMHSIFSAMGSPYLDTELVPCGFWSDF